MKQWWIIPVVTSITSGLTGITANLIAAYIQENLAPFERVVWVVFLLSWVALAAIEVWKTTRATEPIRKKAVRLVVIVGTALVCAILWRWGWQRENIDRLIEKADLAQQHEHFDEAQTALDEATRLLGDRQDALRRGRVSLLVGRIERIHGNADIARQQLQSAFDTLPPQARYDRARSQLELGALLSRLDERGESRKKLDAALREFRALNDHDGTGWAALELAELSLLEDNNDSALQMLNEASTAFDSAHDRVGLATEEIIHGTMEAFRDRPDEGLSDIQKAQDTCRAELNRQCQVRAMQALAELKRQKGDSTEARRLYEDSIPLSGEIHFNLGLQNALLGLANLAATRCEWKNAATKARQVIDYAHSASDRLAEAQAHILRANALTWLGDHDTAIMELQAADGIIVGLGDRALRAAVSFNYALIDFNRQRWDLAISKFQIALKRADEADAESQRAEDLQFLGRAYGKQKRFGDAEGTFKKAEDAFAESAEGVAGVQVDIAEMRLGRQDRTGCGLLIMALEHTARNCEDDDFSRANKLLVQYHCK